MLVLVVMPKRGRVGSHADILLRSAARVTRPPVIYCRTVTSYSY